MIIIPPDQMSSNKIFEYFNLILFGHFSICKLRILFNLCYSFFFFEKKKRGTRKVRNFVFISRRSKLILSINYGCRAVLRKKFNFHLVFFFLAPPDFKTFLISFLVHVQSFRAVSSHPCRDFYSARKLKIRLPTFLDDLFAWKSVIVKLAPLIPLFAFIPCLANPYSLILRHSFFHRCFV